MYSIFFLVACLDTPGNLTVDELAKLLKTDRKTIEQGLLVVRDMFPGRLNMDEEGKYTLEKI